MRDINIRDFKLVCGAMSWVSNPSLVAAVSNAKLPEGNGNGRALGVLATGAMKPDELNEAIGQIKQKTSNTYGVNLIGMSPYYDELVEVCANHQVPIIVLAATVPRREKIEQIKATGAKCIGFATSLRIAQDMVKNGIDGIIIEGSEAGGHVGSIATIVLMQEILFHLSNEVPIIVAGGIGSGKMIQHCLKMGASGVQLGTRFVCAVESPMHETAKEFYIKKQAKDTVVVGAIDPVFSVIPVRVIRNKAVDDFYAKQREAIRAMNAGEVDAHGAQMMIESFWSGSLRRGVLEGDLEYGSLMAGQSISFVDSKQTVQEIVETLYNQMVW